MSYKYCTGWHVRCCMTSDTISRGDCGWRRKSWDSGSIDWPNIEMEERNQFSISFFSFSLLFSSLLHTLKLDRKSAWLKWHEHRILPPPEYSSVEIEVTHASDLLKDPPHHYLLVVEHMVSHNSVHRTIHALCVSHSFFSVVLACTG